MKRFLRIAGLSLLASTVAACTGTEALDVTQNTGADAGGGTLESGASSFRAPSTELTTGNQPQDQEIQAAIDTDARVQFAPVIGAAAEALPPLSGRLSARAAERGITLVTDASSATLVVKGYFSTVADGGRTSVIYVWDVLDASGNRLHRIQGQMAGGEGEGWSVVTPATMEAIADRTIDELTVWLARSSS